MDEAQWSFILLRAFSFLGLFAPACAHTCAWKSEKDARHSTPPFSPSYFLETGTKLMGLQASPWPFDLQILEHTHTMLLPALLQHNKIKTCPWVCAHGEREKELPAT